MRTHSFLLTLFLSLAIQVHSDSLPSGASLIQRLEALQRFTNDIEARVRLTQQKIGQGTKTMEMQYFRRDKDEAFLIHILSPEADRGNGYLRVGEHLWMYRKNTRSFQHINRDESIGGSDVHAEDFETRKLDEIYEVAKDASGKEMVDAGMLGKVPIYRLEVKAKVSDVDYARKIWWVSQEQGLLLKEEAYSRTTLMQTAYFLQYTLVNKRYVPVKQIYIDEFEKGNKTVVDLSSLSTAPLPDALFTKAHLESLSK